MPTRYEVSDADREHFATHGYVHLRGVLSPDEVDDLATTYDRFVRREIPVPGKDYCDMSGDYGREPDDFSIVNVLLPRRYYPAWQGNVFEQSAASIAAGLCGDGMVIDYDQLLAKRPQRPDAVFAWHQDMAYWPDTPDTRTATVWLAIDESTIDNGCMCFVPATKTEPGLRPHHPLLDSRAESHTLATELCDHDVVVPVPIKKGDVTVHDERVMHGTGGNHTDGWRRAYIIAFRAQPTVARERELGFTHSHNDDAAVLDAVGVEGETK